MNAFGAIFKALLISVVAIIGLLFILIGYYFFNPLTFLNNLSNQLRGNSIDTKGINLSAVVQKTIYQSTGSSLYLLRGNSSEEKLLFKHSNYSPGRAVNPSTNVSPDSTSLLIEDGTGGSNGPIYVINLSDSSRRQIGEGFEPSWFNDGKSIIYLKLVGADTAGCDYFKKVSIYTIDTDGSNEKLIPIPSKLMDGGCVRRTPSISPDGTRLLFISEPWLADPQGVARNHDKGIVLNLVNNTFSEVNLDNKFKNPDYFSRLNPPSSGVFSSWSPNSDRFVLILDGHIIGLYDKDGKNLNYYTLSNPRHGVGNFMWLKDNKHLLLQISEDYHSNWVTGGYLAVFNTENNIVKTVYMYDNKGERIHIVSPLSNDNTYLFEVRQTGSLDHINIYVGNSKGTYKMFEEIGTKNILPGENYFWYENK